MKTFSVYQINYTDQQYNELRLLANSPTPPQWVSDYFTVSTGYPAANFHPAIIRTFGSYYKKVAEFACETLDDVFEIGNIGPEEKITRLDRMKSVSVGDVIEDPEGKKWVVASFGFDPLEA